MGKYFDGKTGQVLDQDDRDDKAVINRLLASGRLTELSPEAEKAVKGGPTFPEDRRTRVARNLDQRGVEEAKAAKELEKVKKPKAKAKPKAKK